MQLQNINISNPISHIHHFEIIYEQYIHRKLVYLVIDRVVRILCPKKWKILCA